ncbi:GNAT family N-acetyltransferase [Terriglobus roseus]|uniref:Acetyltransferase (GNAT) family protein n=1 Tax=Terriglobus roseus TaxID=392734 RepID=A0A1H4PRE8_9BACT|nr:GNAT family N-acetyltransferase [Terriglobus roseus]SEC10013.1 Acetyltransferase (GNAT) family protein [Terriglobus roseus]
MSLLIRDAVSADVPEILALIRDLAIYENEPDAAIATEADLLRDGFGPEPYFRCIMAEWDGAVAGFALFFFQYSTWEGRPALYLEDLYVREPFRKRGIGLALFQRLAQIALERQCTRFQWECLDWNQPALDFYENAGAKVLREWLNLRVTGDALQALAGSTR